jgi:hypothetical protein
MRAADFQCQSFTSPAFSSISGISGAEDEAVLTKVLYIKIQAIKSFSYVKELEEDFEEGRDDDNGPQPIENVGALLGITSTKSIRTKAYFKE